MATLSLGWGFLVLGPLPHPDIHFVYKVSTSLWFSSAAHEELVLGSPRHGEYDNRRGLGCKGAGTSQWSRSWLEGWPGVWVCGRMYRESGIRWARGWGVRVQRSPWMWEFGVEWVRVFGCYI